MPVHQLETMFQDLLAKRFNLKLHQESKMLGVYELVAAKGGPKLPASLPSPTSPRSRFVQMQRHDGATHCRIVGNRYECVGEMIFCAH